MKEANHDPIEKKDFFVHLDAEGNATRKRMQIQRSTDQKIPSLSCWKPYYMREYTVDSGAS